MSKLRLPRVKIPIDITNKRQSRFRSKSAAISRAGCPKRPPARSRAEKAREASPLYRDEIAERIAPLRRTRYKIKHALSQVFQIIEQRDKTHEQKPERSHAAKRSAEITHRRSLSAALVT